MGSSRLKIFVPLFLLLSTIIGASAQPAVDKNSTSSISGQVTIGGKGSPGLVVGLSTETPSNSNHITGMKAVTDEEGNYRIKNVPPGTYKVLVAAPDYVQDGPAPVVLGKNEAAENINVSLARGGVITGKVLDSLGRPVIEEQVFLTWTGSGRAPLYWRTIRTDDRGIYRAFGVPAGRYILYAGKDSTSSFGRTSVGYQRRYHPSTVSSADATAILVSEGSEATNVDIVMGREVSKYTARGRIIDGDTSQPLPNARIGMMLFFESNGASSNADAAESTKDGDFKIENLPPGKYAAFFESSTNSESISELVRFEITDQDIEGLLIKTSKGGTVSGVIDIEGPHDPSAKTNLAGTKLFAFFSNDNYGRPRGYDINPDGSFRLTGLPAGRLMLSLPLTQDRLQLMRVERDGVAQPAGIEVRDRERLTGVRVVVAQANGKIRGQLTLPDGLVLPAAARLLVSIRRTEGPSPARPSIEADEGGRFLFDGLVPGTYEFNVGVVRVPDDQRPIIARPTQTVVVTNSEVASITISLQLTKAGP